MEGRAIARPNGTTASISTGSQIFLQWRAGQLPGQTGYPAVTLAEAQVLQWRAGQLPGQTAPDTCSPTDPAPLQWRAGQLPGQTLTLTAGTQPVFTPLQWRAGQLPGQTLKGDPGEGIIQAPSMEGRAIARPNVIAVPRSGIA